MSGKLFNKVDLRYDVDNMDKILDIRQSTYHLVGRFFNFVELEKSILAEKNFIMIYDSDIYITILEMEDEWFVVSLGSNNYCYHKWVCDGVDGLISFINHYKSEKLFG